jgi:hypothetical protein
MIEVELTPEQAATLTPMMADELRMPLASFHYKDSELRAPGEGNTVVMKIGSIERRRIDAVRRAAIGQQAKRDSDATGHQTHHTPAPARKPFALHFL